MKTFWVNGLNKMGFESGTYVLASEANEQDDWNVKKRKELELEQIKANERIKVLEDALKRLSSPLACGCKPCTGDCRSKTALEAELEGRIDFARAALEVKYG